MSWPQVKLGSIFDIARGGSPRPIDDYITDSDDGLNWISIKDASNSNKYIESTRLKIKKEGLSKTRLVKPGDFLLTNSMSFGRPYIMKTTGCIHDGWLVLSGDPEKVDADYFYHLLGSDLVKRRFSMLAAGAVVKNLNIDLVKGVEIPLPPLEEQKRIATILDKADAIRRKRQQAIQLADEFLRAVFLDMFGDPVTNPKGWQIRELKDISRIQIGPFGTQLHKDDYVQGGIPLINPTHIVKGNIAPKGDLTITAEKHASLPEYHLDIGDIVMGRRGEMGRCAVVSENERGWLCGTGSLYIRPKNPGAFSEYLNKLLSSDAIKKHLERESQGATMPNLNKTIVGNIRVPVPSDEALNKFSDAKERIINIKNLNLSYAREMAFESISQKAFSGDL